MKSAAQVVCEVESLGSEHGVGGSHLTKGHSFALLHDDLFYILF